MEVTLVEGYGEKEWPIKSYIGPDGEEWQFYTEEVLFEQPDEDEYLDDYEDYEGDYEDYIEDEDFYFGVYAA